MGLPNLDSDSGIVLTPLADGLFGFAELFSPYTTDSERVYGFCSRFASEMAVVMRFTLNNQERRRLVRHGKKLGPRIKELISIVSYSTFRRWIRNVEDGPTKRPRPNAEGKPGRPRTDESISDTIIRIRKETGWGYTKIVQTMRRLGHRISRQTVKNILVEAGLGPDPQDHPDTWSDFLKRHAATMWQCDFASKPKWTIKGMVDLYFLVFIHVETRRIWVSRESNRSVDDTAGS
jgi:putative transposase